MKNIKYFFRKNSLFVLITAVSLMVILAISFRVEITETNPQFLKCNFNQAKYDSALKEFKQCSEEESKTPFDPSKFREDFPAMGLMLCGLEPEKEESKFYDQIIKYNLVKRTQLKFLGKTIYDTKRAFGKSCKDFGLED